MFKLRDVMVPLHPDGQGVLAAALVAVFVLSFISVPLMGLACVGVVWIWALYANPGRVTPEGQGLIIAPANGVVAEIGTASPPQPLDMAPAPLLRITLVLGPLDSHVMRMPARGVVERVEFRAGRLGDPMAPSAVLENESHAIRLGLAGDAHLGLVQISGRALPKLSWSCVETQKVEPGQVFGTSRLGGRVDLYLPQGAALTVRVGQKMIAGETVLARIA